VTFHGVNEAGKESGNDSITDGRDIAWLQDTPSQDAWGRWNVIYRDIIVLDAEGTVTGIVNVTDNSLENDSTEDSLRELIDAALSAL